MDHSGTIQLIKTDLQGRKYLQTYRIRKLTPRECFRLMGVNEHDITKMQLSGLCKTQQYKLAGNSIVVDVMRYLFNNLFRGRLAVNDTATPYSGQNNNKEARIELLGQTNSSQNSRVIDPRGISYAMANGHKDGMPKIVEPLTCALRGRNPENPSLRTAGIPMQQRLEVGGNVSNCVTSVQKDSLVAEPVVKQIGNYLPTKGWNNPQRGRVYSAEGVSPCVHTCGGGGQEIKIAEPVMVGGIGEKSFGNRYPQGNRVYDSKGIAVCLMSQPVGGKGGFSQLYTVADTNECNHETEK